MLLIVVIFSKRVTLLVRTFTSDEDFAARLLFKSFLVDSLGSNDETNEVDSMITGKVNLRFELLILLVIIRIGKECRADTWYPYLLNQWF